MEVDTYVAEQIAAGGDPEQFRLLVQSVTDCAIFLLDRSGRVISWNEGAERIKGYSAGEIVGRPIALFYPPEDRDAGKPEQALNCAEREGRFQTEGWRLRKDGSRFWADVVITALRDARGGLRGFAKMTRDMTARQRERENEQRVAAMLERQRALAELSLLALGETDLAPDAANQPRRAAVIEDLPSEERFPQSGMLHEHGIVSGMSVMIPGREIPYGVLGAHSAARKHFAPGDAEFLQAV